jgi:sarcosine oxidase gamma subunit
MQWQVCVPMRPPSVCRYEPSPPASGLSLAKSFCHTPNSRLLRLKPKVDIVDQSHGRVRILVRGPMAVRVLAKGTAVDLALSAFPVGHASTTLIGHIAAHVTRIDQDAFELIVLRSFAESLWDELGLMSQEFGKALH